MAWGYNSHRIIPGDWASRRQAVFTRDGDTCHACGHAAADEIDHLLNVAAGGTHDLDNLAPIHGDTCPTCGRRCHKIKTAAEARAARPTRRRPAERHPGLL